MNAARSCRACGPSRSLLAPRLAAGKSQTTWFERHGIDSRTELPDADSIRGPQDRRAADRDDRDQPANRPDRAAGLQTPLEPSRGSPSLNGRCGLVARPPGKLLRLRWPDERRGQAHGEARRGVDLRGPAGRCCPAGPGLHAGRRALPRRSGLRCSSGSWRSLSRPRAYPVPVLRYKPSGLRKRAEWEQTWELQREEDRTGSRLDIPVPPKYTGADFLKGDYNRLRGKLDVPKERWVSFPHCEGPDGTLVIAWAGYDHLQLARSISAYFVDIQERLGGRDDPRLVPLLACLLELSPGSSSGTTSPMPPSTACGWATTSRASSTKRPGSSARRSPRSRPGSRPRKPRRADSRGSDP